MASFVLVHGSWHGAWCWEKLRPLLESRGHRVSAPDLPAHGSDHASGLFTTLAKYSMAVREAAISMGEPVVLVGHSMGGMVVTQAIADAPELFSAAVYVCAFVPQHGESLVALTKKDQKSQVPRSSGFGLRGMYIRPEKAVDLFYHDCTRSEAERAASSIRTEPYTPLFNRFNSNRKITTPRAYVECTDDRVISLDRQRQMAAASGIPIIGSLETGHSPFLSKPEELADVLASHEPGVTVD